MAVDYATKDADYMTVPDHADWDVGYPYTKGSWVNHDILNDWQSILSNVGGSPRNGDLCVVSDTGGDPRWNAWDDDAQGVLTFTNIDARSTGTWYFYCFSCTSSAVEVIILNEDLTLFDSESKAHSNVKGAGTGFLGITNNEAFVSAPGEAIQGGQAGAVIISGQAVGEDGARQLAMGRPWSVVSDGDDILGYWPMYEGDRTRDYSPHGHDATEVGTVADLPHPLIMPKFFKPKGGILIAGAAVPAVIERRPVVMGTGY